jgi:hypothetical protein
MYQFFSSVTEFVLPAADVSSEGGGGGEDRPTAVFLPYSRSSTYTGLISDKITTKV